MPCALGSRRRQGVVGAAGAGLTNGPRAGETEPVPEVSCPTWEAPDSLQSESATCSAMSDPLRPHRMSPARSDGVGWVSACPQNPAHPVTVLLCFQSGPFFSIPPAHTSLATPCPSAPLCGPSEGESVRAPPGAWMVHPSSWSTSS